MRIKPTPAIAVGLLVAYMAVVAGLWLVLGVDYETVADSADNAWRGIVIPVGAGAVFLGAAASWLGWWRPALFEAHRSGPRWAIAVPILVGILALAGVAGIDFGADVGSLLTVLALGVLLVGFSEELLTRGLMLVGFRGGVSERVAWLATSALFGLLHGINVLFGQSVGSTVRQMVLAFCIGSALYVSRMVTGTLLVPMVLHAIWDFGSLGTEGTDGDPVPGVGLLTWPLIIVALVAAWKITGTAARRPESAVAESV